jgi:hypothetical protein
MSIRWIAGIGLVLCVAMTSFSIYLGAIEHVYRERAPRVQVLSTVPPRDFACNVLQFRPTTTTTRGPAPANAACVSAAPSR